MEMSQAAGITLVPAEKRNPLFTTTYGVGEMIRDAIGKGCRRFIMGIGGSATNDGGVGMLQALGYDFLDKEGKQVPYGAQGMEILKTISDKNVLPELADCRFYIACDVTNKLCGDLGCSAVYGPQKGASPEMIAQMISGWNDMPFWRARPSRKRIPNSRERERQAASDSRFFHLQMQCWNPGLNWY